MTWKFAYGCFARAIYRFSVFRETSKHLAELEAYLDEKALPQIEAEQERRWEKNVAPIQQRVDFSVRAQSAELLRQAEYGTIISRLFEDKADE